MDLFGMALIVGRMDKSGLTCRDKESSKGEFLFIHKIHMVFPMGARHC